MTLYTAMAVKNNCYKANGKLAPKGIVVHTTGAVNPELRRYVGWGEIPEVGINQYNNHWNQPLPDGRQICCHAFIGLLADAKTVATVQIMPWNMRGWHVGGSGNNNYLGFEICEGDVTNLEYCKRAYNEAVDLTAYLCMKYNIPVNQTTVIGHYEAYAMGLGTNHSDPKPYFNIAGRSMNSFRTDVKAVILNGGPRVGGDDNDTEPLVPIEPNNPAADNSDEESWFLLKGNCPLLKALKKQS